jgi:hypothetical protein
VQPRRRRGCCGARTETKEARALLADICGWSTEGLDTLDLKTADALSNELAG